MHRAIFLDRDGTLNEEMGYINHPQRFRVFPFSAESIRIFNNMGFMVIVVTNQSGVARGYFSENMLKQIHTAFLTDMKEQHAHIDAIYYCPHLHSAPVTRYAIDCDCRKPKPGMIQRAVKEFDINLKESYGIGDRYKDILFAKQNGMKSGLVLTGYGRGEYEFQQKSWSVFPDIIGETLLDVAKQIHSQHIDSI